MMDENLLIQLEEKAYPQIVADLQVENVKEVVEKFNELLRLTLDITLRVPSPEGMQVARKVGESLIEKIATLPVEQRLNYVEEQLLERQMGELDISSWNMVKKTLLKNYDQKVLKALAQELLEEAHRLQKILAGKPQSWRPRFGRTMSDILLDCQYVLGQTDKLSFRFGRVINSLKRGTNDH
jgi:hypothetical protein